MPTENIEGIFITLYRYPIPKVEIVGDI